MNKIEKSFFIFSALFCLLIFVLFIVFDVENRKMLDYTFLIYLSCIAAIYYVSRRKWKLHASYLLITLFLGLSQVFNISISYDTWANRGFPPKWEFLNCCDEGIW